MDKQPISDKIRHIVFKLVTPIYLWSIGMKSLKEYWDSIYEHESMLRDNKPKS